MTLFAKLQAAVNSFPSLRVGVVGDLMVDRFIYGTARRISPEAPVPVVHILERTTQPGGAANVGNNVLSLGAQLSLFGVLGDDEAGSEVRALLDRQQANLSGVLHLARRPSTIKTRVVAQTQQLVRFDEEDISAVDSSTWEQLQRLIEGQISSLQVLVLSDYAKGLFSHDFVRGIIELGHRAGVICVADPKPANISYFRGIDLIKPNMSEALRLVGLDRDVTDAEMPDICRQVRASAQSESVIITAGARGMFILEHDEFKHLPGRPREVFDVAGAGDTTLAAMALSLAAGLSLYDAAILGNLAGSIAVGKLGIAAVTGAELQAELEAVYGHA